MKSKTLAVLVACQSVGCLSPGYTMSISSAQPLAPKAAACDFRVVNLPPQGYEELGTLTYDPIPTYEPTDFKKLVAKDVCRVGGEVVVTEINGQGAYVRGTVLRSVSKASDQPK